MDSGRFIERPRTGSHALAVLALLLLACGSSRADRLDDVAFAAPAGWSREAVDAGLLFTSPATGAGGFCQMLLSRSRSSAAALADELDRAWSIMTGRHSVIGEAVTAAPRELGSGITLAQRTAALRAEGGGTYLMLLNLLRRGDRQVMVVANMADAKAFERCRGPIDGFIAGLRIDPAASAQGAPTPSPSPPPSAGAGIPPGSPTPRSDPQLAARFGHSIVGTWRYALTAATVTLNAPTQTRNVIELPFAPDGSYGITYSVAIPGSSNYRQSQTGRYRVEGQRIAMQPQPGNGRPYTLDWFFGDHPEHHGNWGLILRSNADWIGGDKDDWRTFKPAP